MASNRLFFFKWLLLEDELKKKIMYPQFISMVVVVINYFLLTGYVSVWSDRAENVSECV